jgi:hypothetical protein
MLHYRSLLSCFASVLVISAASSSAADITYNASVSLVDQATRDAYQDKLWFPVGERLEYKLYWGVIPVGSAEFDSRWIMHNGRPMLSLQARARTNKVVKHLFPVDDRIESIVDPESFLTIEYTQRIHEGKKTRDEVTIFDRENLVAYYTSYKTGESSQILIEPDTRDVLALTYYMRKTGIDEDETKKFEVLVDNKLWSLMLNNDSTEKIDLPGFGNVSCQKLIPQAKFGEIFNRKGKVNLWFSDDARRLCTKMTGKVPLADVKAVLTTVMGPGEDSWVNGDT